MPPLRHAHARPRRRASTPHAPRHCGPSDRNGRRSTDVAPDPTATSRISPTFAMSSTRTSSAVARDIVAQRLLAVGEVELRLQVVAARPDRVGRRRRRSSTWPGRPSSHPHSPAARPAGCAPATRREIDTNARSAAVLTTPSPVVTITGRRRSPPGAAQAAAQRREPRQSSRSSTPSKHEITERLLNRARFSCVRLQSGISTLALWHPGTSALRKAGTQRHGTLALWHPSHSGTLALWHPA